MFVIYYYDCFDSIIGFCVHGHKLWPFAIECVDGYET